MLVTLTQQSLELEDGTGKKKEQSLKIFETKKCSWSTEQRISFLYSYVDFLMFTACKIHAYQLIHYSNGSLEESHLQEKPIYDGHTMIPVCKPTRAPGKVQICECPPESKCSPALQPVPCKLCRNCGLNKKKHPILVSPKLACRSALALVLREPHCPSLPCTQHSHLVNWQFEQTYWPCLHDKRLCNKERRISWE